MNRRNENRNNKIWIKAMKNLNLTQTNISFLSSITPKFDIDFSDKYRYLNFYSGNIDFVTKFFFFYLKYEMIISF